MNQDMYDQEYLELTLEVLKDNTADLKEWSVYNGDKGSDEIHELRQALEKVQRVLAIKST